MKNKTAPMLALISLFTITGCNNTQTSNNPSTNTNSTPTVDNIYVPEGTKFKDVHDENFVPVIRFVVCSDLHVSHSASAGASRFESLLITANNYAESSPIYKGLDAVVVVGDLSYDAGTEEDYTTIKSILSKRLKKDTKFIPVMGNHDIGNKEPWSDENYRKYMDNEIYKNVNIKGFNFIGISPINYYEFSDEAISFMDNALTEATKDGSTKPIFTFQHQHLKDTVYLSPYENTTNSKELINLYSKYSQVINFSGHSHGPISNPRNIWQGDFTALGTGTLAAFYMEPEFDDPQRENYGNVAQYQIVEVDANNHVKIKPYNIMQDDFFKDPETASGKRKQLVFDILNPADKSTFKYVDINKNADAPYYDKDDEMSFSSITRLNAIIRFPQAKDKYCVYGYEIEIKSDKKTITGKVSSNYFIEPLSKKLSFFANGLEKNTTYKVSVTPINAYNKKGEPLVGEFTTKE